MPGYMKRGREEEAPLPGSEDELESENGKGGTKERHGKSPRRDSAAKGSARKPVRTLPKELGGARMDVMEDLVVANAELSLEKAIDTREQAGFLLRTILVPITCMMVVEGLAEAKAFAKELKGKRGQDIGPAHVRIFLAAMKGLASWEEAAKDALLRGPFEVFWNEVVMKVDAETLKEHVQIFKIFKPKIMGKVRVKVGEEDKELGEYARIQMRMRPGSRLDSRSEDFQEALLDFARRQGWKVQVGTAPKTTKERKLTELLAKVKGR